MPAPDAGPFRDASPTPEALRARERAASLARVEAICQRAIARQRRLDARLDALSFFGLTGALLATGVTLGLGLVQPRGPWLALLCPVTSMALSAAFALLHRSRRHDRRAIRLWDET